MIGRCPICGERITALDDEWATCYHCGWDELGEMINEEYIPDEEDDDAERMDDGAEYYRGDPVCDLADDGRQA